MGFRTKRIFGEKDQVTQIADRLRERSQFLRRISASAFCALRLFSSLSGLIPSWYARTTENMTKLRPKRPAKKSINHIS